MSSFIHSAEAFNSVEQATKKLLSDRDFKFYPYHFKQWPELFEYSSGFKKETAEEKIKTVFNYIRVISVICVTLQYSDKNKTNTEALKEIKGEIYDICHGSKKYKELSKEGLIRSLGSIEYQIETEHLEKWRPLNNAEIEALEFIKALRCALALHIFTHSRQYESADSI